MMKCTEDGCVGEIDLTGTDVSLRTGCMGFEVAFPCKICGRLHFLRGNEVHKCPVGVETRGGQRAFFMNGEVVHR
jgi:hypothetical protein